MPSYDILALLGGDYWNGIENPGTGDTGGSPVIVTFSFPTSIPGYVSPSTVEGFTQATVDSFVAFGAAEQAQALQALNDWASASGIIFVQVAPGQGDINFSNVDFNTTSNPSYAGYGGIGFYPFGNWSYASYPYFTSDLDASGDVFMNTQFLNNGTVTFGTLLHEIGHALGLKHPDEIVTNYAALPTPVVHNQTIANNPSLTVMATVGDEDNPDTNIKPLDSAAVAFLYGSSGGQVIDSTTTFASGTNSVSSWTWDAITQTLTQTATGTSEAIHGTSINDVITGSTGDDTLLGLNGNDTLFGLDGNDLLFGGPGTNTMEGGTGDDTYYVDSPTDILIEGTNAGYDSVYATVSFTLPDNFELLQVYGSGLTAQGNDQGDTLYGDPTNSTTLIGGTGVDYILGGAAGDRILGGGNFDLMYGGGGDDVFIFNAVTDAPVSNFAATTIGDFTANADKIDMSALQDSNGDPLHFSNAGTFSGSPGEVIDRQSGTNTVIGVDLNGDKIPDMQILLYGTPALTANDFIFTPLCFLAGTMILTPDGERRVETLAAGDMVRTAAGVDRRVVWVGHGRQLASPGRRNAATPVLVMKGALGDNVPAANLRLTKAHALYLDDMLVPVEFLVNHRSIRWDDHAREFDLYHIELESHDILVANGAPAESFRDDGNRWLFQNANSGWGLPPQAPCAPVVTDGPALDALWRRLLDRAGGRPSLRLTDEPDLHLLVDGNRIDPSDRYGNAYCFRLPTPASAVRLRSRAAIPQELGVVRDPRTLGVAVRRIAVWQGETCRTMDAGDPGLVAGFHPAEPGTSVQWTDGDAALPDALFAGSTGPVEIVVNLGGRTLFQVLPEAPARAA